MAVTGEAHLHRTSTSNELETQLARSRAEVKKLLRVARDAARELAKLESVCARHGIKFEIEDPNLEVRHGN